MNSHTEVSPWKTFSGRVALGILIATVLVVAVLVVSRGYWLINPSPLVERRVDIITQMIVGFGTTALAVVTWASVYETQQVISGEDKRFRQSRMPMLRLRSEPTLLYHAGRTGLRLEIENAGDGPAQDVRVALRGRITMQWYRQRVRVEGGKKYTDPREVGGTVETALAANDQEVESYLGTDDLGVAFVEYASLETPAGDDGTIISNEPSVARVRNVKILYTDVFSEEFTTAYDASAEGLDVRSFRVIRPPRYRK